MGQLWPGLSVALARQVLVCAKVGVGPTEIPVMLTGPKLSLVRVTGGSRVLRQKMDAVSINPGRSAGSLLTESQFQRSDRGHADARWVEQ